MKPFVGLLLALPAFVASPPTLARAQSPASTGAAVYAERCATCHDATDATRAPSRESLRARSTSVILATLSPTGVMAPQGAQLTDAEKQAVATFLAQSDSAASPPSPAPAATPAASPAAT